MVTNLRQNQLVANRLQTKTVHNVVTSSRRKQDEKEVEEKGKRDRPEVKPAAAEEARLEAMAWCLRGCALRPRDAGRWEALARVLEDLAAPLLPMVKDLARPAALKCPEKADRRALSACAFGDDAALATAPKLTQQHADEAPAASPNMAMSRQ